MKTPPRWAIRVTFLDGREAWLRHGAMMGEGARVLFTSKARAEKEAEFVSDGLDANSVITIVRVATRK